MGIYRAFVPIIEARIEKFGAEHLRKVLMEGKFNVDINEGVRRKVHTNQARLGASWRNRLQHFLLKIFGR